MINYLSQLGYVKVESVTRDTIVYLEMAKSNIVCYLLQHRKETLNFFTLDSHLLFTWENRKLCVPPSVSCYFIDIEKFIGEVREALLREKPIIIETYSAVVPAGPSYLCLCTQPKKGEGSYNFLSAETGYSDDFIKIADSKGIILRNFICDAIFLLTTTYIGNTSPFHIQYFRYDKWRFKVTISRNGSKTKCYFDTSHDVKII